MNTRVYLVLVVLAALWCLGIVVAPALHAEYPEISSGVYRCYAPICHQIEGRSFHLFGAKLAVCSRCSSIYLSFFISLLLLPLVRDLSALRVPRRSWVLLAVLPMVIDVGLTLTGLYASSPLMRALTGGLFGLILPLYIVPPLLEGISQLRNQYIARGGFFYARKAQ